MISRARIGLVTACVMALGSLAPTWGQTSTPEPTPAPAKDKQKTFWDEFKLFSYIEMGATFNLNGGSEGVPGSTSNGWTNPLRFYDIDQGYTFNMAELSIKRDPDEAFPFGMGLVLTAGQDAQKNHSIGILRGENDAFPFRNTPWFDLQELYVSARLPIGNGPVIKVGKFVSLLGYEVIESPLNLNYRETTSSTWRARKRRPAGSSPTRSRTGSARRRGSCWGGTAPIPTTWGRRARGRSRSRRRRICPPR